MDVLGVDAKVSRMVDFVFEELGFEKRKGVSKHDTGMIDARGRGGKIGTVMEN